MTAPAPWRIAADVDHAGLISDMVLLTTDLPVRGAVESLLATADANRELR